MPPASRKTHQKVTRRGVLRVGFVPLIDAAPLIAAADLGYFAEEGLEVEYNLFDSGARMVAPLAAGQLDVGQGSHSAGLFNALATGVELKIWDYMKFYYDVNAWIPKNVVLVNKRAYDALDPATRDALRKAAADAELRGWKLSQDHDRTAKDELKTQRVKVLPPDWSVAMRFRRFGEQLAREWLKTAGPDALDIVLALELEKAHVQPQGFAK